MEINETGRNKDNLEKLSHECSGTKPKQTFLLSSYSFIIGRGRWEEGVGEGEGGE